MVQLFIGYFRRQCEHYGVPNELKKKKKILEIHK